MSIDEIADVLFISKDFVMSRTPAHLRDELASPEAYLHSIRPRAKHGY
jgi:hypothetical protein